MAVAAVELVKVVLEVLVLVKLILVQVAVEFIRLIVVAQVPVVQV